MFYKLILELRYWTENVKLENKRNKPEIQRLLKGNTALGFDSFAPKSSCEMWNLEPYPMSINSSSLLFNINPRTNLIIYSFRSIYLFLDSFWNSYFHNLFTASFTYNLTPFRLCFCRLSSYDRFKKGILGFDYFFYSYRSRL